MNWNDVKPKWTYSWEKELNKKYATVVLSMAFQWIQLKKKVESKNATRMNIELKGKKLNWKMPEGRWPKSCCPRGPACPPPPASSQLLDCQLLDCQDDDDADHDGITGIPWFQCALYCFVLQFLLTSSHNEDGNMCAWPVVCHEALLHVSNTNTNTNTKKNKKKIYIYIKKNKKKIYIYIK